MRKNWNITIVHYGEHVPSDKGYRPVRYGRLAEYLTTRGHTVTRISPSFCYAYQQQRPLEWSGRSSAEGLSIIVPTRSYVSSRGLERFRSLKDFCNGSAKALLDNEKPSVVITGYPPPGNIRLIRNSVGPTVPIIADIRDLWPDALIPSSLPGSLLKPAATAVGKVLGLEFRFANKVVALSPTMLARAPRQKRGIDIPIGIPDSNGGREKFKPNDAAPFTFVFVGSFSHLFDFKAMISGWQIFKNGRPCLGNARLLIYGAGRRESELIELSKNVPDLHLMGWLDNDKVWECLGSSDVGVSPSRRGQGVTFGNKISEYMASGLYVLNSLELSTASRIKELNLGHRVQHSEHGWANGFEYCFERSSVIRADRTGRLDRADQAFGSERSEAAWLETIESVLAD